MTTIQNPFQLDVQISIDELLALIDAKIEGYERMDDESDIGYDVIGKTNEFVNFLRSQLASPEDRALFDRATTSRDMCEEGLIQASVPTFKCVAM
ncbi:MAG: hypothetical protein V7693_15945 [Halopseudomonas sabulinigri]